MSRGDRGAQEGRRRTTPRRSAVAPAYTHRLDLEPIPKFKMPLVGARPEVAYRLIHDELLLDGSSRLNLATFVTTWMEPEADRLMAEAFDKNMIDKDEYPQTAEIERRCVNMVAAPVPRARRPGADAVGASTIGSSEAVMLAGLAMKWRWRARAGRRGQADRRAEPDPRVQRPGRVGEVLPLLGRRAAVRADQAAGPVRDHAGRGRSRGSTRTRSAWSRSSARRTRASSSRSRRSTTRSSRTTPRRGSSVPLHVDAASGGFVAPFLHPHLKWDFRLPKVESINVSGHKYGLMYPGVGFVVWRVGGLPARGPGLPRELPRRRHADVHAELLATGQPDRRPVLQLPAAGACGLRA